MTLKISFGGGSALLTGSSAKITCCQCWLQAWHQMPIATQAAMMGGNVRVGLEDSLFIGRGKLATNNAEQVARVRSILEALG